MMKLFCPILKIHRKNKSTKFDVANDLKTNCEKTEGTDLNQNIVLI